MEFSFGHPQAAMDDLKVWVLWALVMSPIFALIPQRIFSLRGRAYAVMTVLFALALMAGAIGYATSFFGGISVSPQSTLDLSFQAPRERTLSVPTQSITGIKFRTYGSRPGPDSCAVVIETIDQTYESHPDQCQKVEAARTAINRAVKLPSARRAPAEHPRRDVEIKAH